MTIWLELDEPGTPPRRFRLQRDEVRVGASSRNDVVLCSAGAPVRAWTLRVTSGGVEVESHGHLPPFEAPLQRGGLLIAPSDAGPVRLRIEDLQPHALWSIRVEPPSRAATVAPAVLSAEQERAIATFATSVIRMPPVLQVANALQEAAKAVGLETPWLGLTVPDGEKEAWSSTRTFGAPVGGPTPSAWLGAHPDALASLASGATLEVDDGNGAVRVVPVVEDGRLYALVTYPASAGLRADWQPLLQVLQAYGARYPVENERQSLEEENRYFRDRQRRHYLLKDLVSQAPTMRAVHTQLRDLLGAHEPVLMTGEAGTGKELLARALHHLGGRARALLVAQHCGVLDEDTLDYELFGHAATGEGATGASRRGVLELCDGGTVFLDEVHLLSQRLQMKLLRALTEGEIFRIGESQARGVDVRVVAATHLDLMALADEGRFRRDLALALTRNVLHVPALRDRREDLPTLVDVFVRQFARRYRKDARRVDSTTLDWLVSLPWPGNVRELQTVMERAVLHASPEQTTLGRADFDWTATSTGDAP